MARLFEPLGVDHVVLHVRDLAASERFYAEVLGCTVERVNPKFSLVQLRCGQSLIDLLPLASDAPAPAPEHGMDHLCLSIRCDDLEPVAAELRSRGVRVEGEVVTRYGAFGEGPSLYLRDPDGYRIELKPR